MSNEPKHIPATPLPWIGGLPYKTNIYGREHDVIAKDDAYELHAANAYPKLIAAVIECQKTLERCRYSEQPLAARMANLLRDLGEL